MHASKLRHIQFHSTPVRMNLDLTGLQTSHVLMVYMNRK